MLLLAVLVRLDEAYSINKNKQALKDRSLDINGTAQHLGKRFDLFLTKR